MFKKPNKKSITDSAVQVVSLGVGLKVGDGVVSLFPESTNSYKNWVVGVLGIGLAACVNPSTTSGLAAQSALAGIGAKGFYNGVTEAITPSIDKQDSSTTMGKFINAVVGHQTMEKKAFDPSLFNEINPITRKPYTYDEVTGSLNMPWEPAEQVWDRPGDSQDFAQRTLNISMV